MGNLLGKLDGDSQRALPAVTARGEPGISCGADIPVCQAGKNAGSSSRGVCPLPCQQPENRQSFAPLRSGQSLTGAWRNLFVENRFCAFKGSLAARRYGRCSTPCSTSTGGLPGLPTWDSSGHGAARRTLAKREPRELRFHPHAPAAKRPLRHPQRDLAATSFRAHQGGALRSTHPRRRWVRNDLPSSREKRRRCSHELQSLRSADCKRCPGRTELRFRPAQPDVQHLRLWRVLSAHLLCHAVL